jgi:hypothetical protein
VERPNDDPWLAADKLQHFALSAAGTLAAYHLLLRHQRDGAVVTAASLPARARRRANAALAAAALLAAALGLIKELGDGPLALWPGRASMRDGIADGLGIAAAVAWARMRGGGGGGSGDLMAAADQGDEGLPLVMLRPPAVAATTNPPTPPQQMV